MPSIREPELEEDEWDPQGLNAMSFEDDEEDEEDEEEVEGDENELDAVVELTEEDDEEEGEGSDSVGLDVDGLTELEQMEQSLLREESLDFAMIGEEE